MFLSVKERARQIASGQFQTNDQVAPPTVVPPKASPKIVTAKFAPKPEPEPEPTAPTPKPTPKSSPTPKTKSKPASKTSSSIKPSVSTTSTSTKAEPAKPIPKPTPTPKSKTKSVSKTSSAVKSGTSKTSSSTKAETTKTRTSPKPASPEPTKTRTPPKAASPKPVRSKTLLSKIGIGSFAENPAEEDTEVSDLKAACLKQVSGMSVLAGRRLAIVLKQSSSSGEWYAALKDTSSDKYLKMWMNRSKTFPTQTEALEAYLAFVKKMKMNCGLFPMSPKRSKSKE